VGAEVVLEDGDVVDEILEKSRRIGADLLVMGTHGRRGFRRLILGSVTERVLRQSESPVLSIPPSAPERNLERGEAFLRILCPVDYSPSSRAGLELATNLRQGDADLVVLHVLEYQLPPPFGEAVAFDFAGFLERRQQEDRVKLESWVPEAARAHSRVETALLESGSPYRQILRVAEREKSDLIVIGVCSRSSADLAFFGSTANHVVREAACPVLTVRSGIAG
jgi:nucleotide-binding universal stress UspA family protein